MNASRQLLYGILITVAVGGAVGRILCTQLLFEPSIHRDEKDPNDRRRLWPKVRPAQMPTFSSNDRSRWATVRALVDEGTFVIGHRNRDVTVATAVAPLGGSHLLDAAVALQMGYYFRVGSDRGVIFEDGYQSVDKVLQPGTLNFYSSKPPLLSALIAVLYWLLKTCFGWTLAEHPDAVVRTIVLLVNALPFAIYLGQVAKVAESFGRTDWGRYFVVACAAFATLVTPFVITLNNHTIATYCVLFALICTLKVWRLAPRERGGCAEHPGPSPWHLHAAAGFFASFAVCNELPALSFAVALFVLHLYWAPRHALTCFLGMALLMTVAFFLINLAAIGQLRPAYSEFGGEWYEYEGSHWRKPFEGQPRKTGIDWARDHETRVTYITHLLVGHHGLYSLTPLWLLAIVSMVGGLWRLKRNWRRARQPTIGELFPRSPALPWFLPPLALAVTVAVVGFYAFKSDNYGGFTVGPRWLMWLSPLWLVCLIPIADRLGKSRWGRGIAYLFLGISVLSANYSPWNPWRHPWLYDFMVALGWPGY